jgi:hypothetical protein
VVATEVADALDACATPVDTSRVQA